MTSNKNNGDLKTLGKITSKNGSKQHSQPFYFSNSLFNNRRLKQKRLKRTLTEQPSNMFLYNRRRTLAALKPQKTIDLLSDDENNDNTTTNEFIDITNIPLHTQQEFQKQSQLLMPQFHSLNKELYKSPNITLVPVANQCLAVTGQRNTKRKRKSLQPKRVPECTVFNNNESIVLSDDSDVEILPTASSSASSVNHINMLNTFTNNHRNNYNQNITAFEPPPPLAPLSTNSIDHEEVTVSIVPRSSTAGNCGAVRKPSSTELFPMLPDETTVHTVIANRTYELPLAKLKEGLASVAPEFSQDVNPQGSPSPRTKCGMNTNTTATTISPPNLPEHVSLKLSSDLSISLISDDDEDDEFVVEQRKQEAEKMLRQQPQLLIQQLHLPDTNGTKPIRRKLG